jgi:DNA polymerase-3 subunit delta
MKILRDPRDHDTQMLILVHGEDSFRSQAKVTAMRARFRETRDVSGLNERVLRASEHSLEDVQEALFSSPFLADRKLVVLQGFLGLKKADQEAIVDMLDRAPDSTVAIFHEQASGSALAKSPLFARLKNEDFSEEFAGLDGASAEAFVAQECAASGMKIDRKAARALVGLAGLDVWTLHQEAAKVSAYAGALNAKIITEAMVNDMVNGERDESVFPFLDACMQGQAGKAAVLLEGLVKSGTSEFMVLSMLAKQMRTMLGAKDLERRGYHDKNEVAKKLGIHPFPAGKAVAAVRAFSYERLLHLHDRLIELEGSFKTSGPDLLAGLDLFSIEAAEHAQG